MSSVPAFWSVENRRISVRAPSRVIVSSIASSLTTDDIGNGHSHWSKSFKFFSQFDCRDWLEKCWTSSSERKATVQSQSIRNRYDDEFLQYGNKDPPIVEDGQTTMGSSCSSDTRLSWVNIREEKDEEHLSVGHRSDRGDGEERERLVTPCLLMMKRFVNRSIPKRNCPFSFKRRNFSRLSRTIRWSLFKATRLRANLLLFLKTLPDDRVQRNEPVNIVVITEPRQWPIGQTIGYQTSRNKQRYELTRIVFCTTGVLLHKWILSKTLEDSTHIILIRTFGLINCRKVKIRLVSPTIEMEKLAAYFCQPRDTKHQKNLIKMMKRT